MFKTIVFDLDMTLCYPTERFDDVFNNVFGTTLESVMPTWMEMVSIDGACTGIEAIESCFPERDRKERVALFTAFTQRWAEVQTLYHGVHSLPDRLREQYQCRVGIMTNGPSVFQHSVIEALGLNKTFDFWYSSGDASIALRKPNNALVKLLEQKERIDPASALFIGDTLEKDIAPAIACGWSGLHVNPTDSKTGPMSFSAFEKLMDTGRCVSVNWSQLS